MNPTAATTNLQMGLLKGVRPDLLIVMNLIDAERLVAGIADGQRDTVGRKRC